jgi:metallo-beta-lactamase family protein
MKVKIKFLGAAGTVTGSKYLVSYDKYNILVDAGMFQGDKEWREHNWEEYSFNPKSINAVCLTHAHIDHTGILPRIVNHGLNCPVFCTPSTADLTKLLLLDSARLQEQEAEYRQQRGKSKHNPALPLYRQEDAFEANQLLKPIDFSTRVEVAPNIFATWSRMGHILGAGAIKLEIGGRVINFSGDIGRYTVPILVDPAPIEYGDLLLIESTYGNRLHPPENPKPLLTKVINKAYKRGGAVIIPSFAVGRAQQLLYYLRELKIEKLIPDLPVIIDSPMAADATEIYQNNPSDYDEQALKLFSAGKQPFAVSNLAFIQSTEDSIRLNSIDHPMIIISASGMLTGGRILHHLKHRISDPRNTILFVGFQPAGSRGAWIKSGADTLRLFGEEQKIRAEIEEISGLSGHADRDELIRWCKSGTGKPKNVAVVHGELEAAFNFSATLNKELGWDSFRPKYLEEFEL